MSLDLKLSAAPSRHAIWVDHRRIVVLEDQGSQDYGYPVVRLILEGPSVCIVEGTPEAVLQGIREADERHRQAIEERYLAG